MRIVVVGYGKGSQDGGKNNVVLLLKELAKQQSLEVIEAWDGSAVKVKSLPEKFVLLYFHRYKSQLLLKWLYEVKVPSLVKKMKADIVISLDGCCSKATEAPQIMVLNDVAYLTGDKKKRSAAKNYSFKNIGLFLNRAAFSIVDTEAAKEYIEGEYRVEEDKIQIVYPSVRDCFKPCAPERREKIKAQYAEGKEYFLSVGDGGMEGFVDILKAFSVFKKWQQSNMKLLVVYKGGKMKVLEVKLMSYKYRNDVQLVSGDVDEYAEVLSGAYAMIDTGKGGDVMVVLEALKCGVPVVSLQKERLGAMCGEGILYVASGEPQSFGKGMVELYKNEKLRSEMAGAALREAFKFDMGENARGLWEVISGGGHKGAKGPKSSL